MGVKYLYVEVGQAPERPLLGLTRNRPRSKPITLQYFGAVMITRLARSEPAGSTTTDPIHFQRVHGPSTLPTASSLSHGARSGSGRSIAGRLHGMESSTSMSCHRLASSASSSHQAYRPTTALVQPA
jgi:hypothetical protein